MRSARTWSIRTRLALWHASSLVAILAILGVFAVAVHDRAGGSEIDGDLRLIANSASDLISLGATPSAVSAALDRLDEPPLIRLFYRVVLRDGTVLDGGNWPVGVAPAAEPGFRTAGSGRDRVRLLVQGLGSPMRGTIEVGTYLDKLEASRKALVRVFLLIGPFAILLAGLGGYWLATRALRPIAAITERARSLGVGRLKRDRLPIVNPDDELGRLAATINAMLDRIARAVDEIRRFGADASHELKTPLTILKGELGLAARGDRRPAAYRAVIASALEEVDRMHGLVERLLRLARSESGEVRYERAPVALDRIAREVAEHLHGPAEREGLAVEVDAPTPVTVTGDDPRLRELMVILLDNAIRYTPSGGSVRIRVAPEPRAARIAVEDTGVGIPAEALPRVFEPFFRVDQSRARAAGGTGLGLAIARATVEGHGGRIEIASRVGAGTTVTVRLPADGPAPGDGAAS